MVRLRLDFLLIIKLFSVILFSMLCSNTGAENISIVTRPCDNNTRCRSGYIVSSSSSILEGNSSMSNRQNLTSNGGNFTVGFFVRGKNMYLGTWYTSSSSPEKVIVWVANRDKPIPSRLCHNCSLFLEPDGKAVVLDSNNQSYWSTENSTTSKPSFPYLEILDNGNLKLLDRGGRGGVLWQSFDEPTDTFLLGMNLISLTSWKSDDDPAQGNYLFQNKKGMTTPVLLMYNLSHTSNPETLYWDSRLSSLPPGLTALLTNNMTEDLRLLRLVMNSTGSIQLWKLDQKGGNWSIIWMAPQGQCDFIDTCGIHGVCDSYNGFRCKCLPGYNPNNPDKWESKDFSGGCSKKTKGQCGEVFLSLPMIKLPNQQDITPLTSTNETECRKQCVFNCECEAYSFDANQSSCLIWKYDLTHIQEEYYNVNANTLYIRLNRSDTDSRSRTCGVCGTNVIPYPLSTNRSCGDLAYFSFECNNTNGQLYFKPSPPNGKHYKVSVILPEQRKFTVQLVAPSVLSSKCDSANNIEAKQLNLNTSSPFKVTNCSIVTLIETTPQSPLIEVELTWNPPSQPLCNSTADCKDWLDTNCGWDKDGKKVCLCTKGSHWNSLFANCTRAQKTMPLLLKVGIACGTVIFLLSCISFVICLRRRQLTHTPAGTVDQFKMDDIEHDIDIPFVDYQSIVAATDNFSDTNKLGAGGFGPVYKGMLGDGNEVAIKRLSAASTQGVLEFRNEIVLIAKLQHRNLVRVVGYCIQEDEKILIYEYMPNKSLDSFLFDQSMSTTLDWIKRFDIIMGIARGLVYLHQDSRLRIIHRDLKPSNILLDEELNPKISDFGLAKIIAGKEIATSTARVIGTYGYMSPEYALEGYFSVKSDVYSFGIIVFEVISGKRCTSLLQGDNNLISLLGYAWALWKEGKEFELVDESIADTWNSIEVRRCINVALLCVQEDPSDRPTMSSVLLMLGGDNMNLPDPKQPVFVARRQPSTSTSSSKLGSTANVEFTTNVEGR